MKIVDEISSCEVCGSSSLERVLDLGMHPMCDDLVPTGSERRCDEYPIEILYCAKCSTAHQRFQVPKRTLFPATYHYRSRFTADVLKGMEALVESCSSRIGNLRGKLVLDVGCNDGSLLDIFRQAGARTVGIEPTGAYKDGIEKGHEILNSFLSNESAEELLGRHGSPDIITFTNVFAHIEDLQGAIRALRHLMSPSTVVVIENHYLGAVLDRHQFDTFYHEHPRTYSVRSFEHIARHLGSPLAAVEFPERYGGNVRVFIGTGVGTLPPDGDTAIERESDFGARLARMQNEIESWKLSTKARIRSLVSAHGPLWAKAFPGRAAILVRLLELDTNCIEAVFEKPGSMKIGHYVPGTRIPIRSDEELLQDVNARPVILNLAWHISTEIRSYLRGHGYTGDVVDILSPQDFGDQKRS